MVSSLKFSMLLLFNPLFSRRILSSGVIVSTKLNKFLHTQRVTVTELNGSLDKRNITNFDTNLNEDAMKNVNIQIYSKFASNIQIGENHNFISDLKEKENGENLGPSPKELCLSALGSCTVMTIRTFYENTKQLNPFSEWASSELTNISVELNEVLNEPNKHVPDGIEMQIKLTGKLSQNQKDRLLKAASNCPVKKMLNSDLKINLHLV